MAVSFIANALGATNSTTSFSITLPATVAGDIIILEFAHRGTDNGTIGGTYTGPAFTLKRSQLFNSSTFSGKTYYSRATGDHAGETVTNSGLTNSCAAIVTVYRGALASGDPLADAEVSGEPNPPGNETLSQITTATDGAWVVLVVVNSPDLAVATQACTSPGTLTERAERLSTGGTDSSIAHASAAKATAGVTGALTWTQTNAASGSWAYAITPEPIGFSLDAQPGSFTLTGAVAGVLANLVIDAQPGLFTLTGVEAALVKGFVLSADPGTFTVSGVDATLFAAALLSADPGVYVITGAEAGLVVARVMDAQPGAFEIVGFDAGLVHSGGGEPVASIDVLYLLRRVGRR